MAQQVEAKHDSAKWHCDYQIDKFFTKDVEELEHVVEYHDFDLRAGVPQSPMLFGLPRLLTSPVLKGQQGVRDFMAWLERQGLDIPDMHLSLRPKAKCITSPDEQIKSSGNILVYSGISCIWETLIGNGTATAGQSLTYFNNSQAAIGIGDSSTAAAATQTDLQASSNKLRVGMNSSYPQHTAGSTSASNTITWQSTFGSTQANYSWNEAAVFNSATLATGSMLQRLVSSLGSKSAGAWSVGIAVSLS